MKVVVSAEMRDLDRITIEHYRVSGETLMDRAGEGVARAVDRLTRGWDGGQPPVLVFAGRGNNGGDAFAAARCLAARGFRAEVWFAGESAAARGDPRVQLRKMRELGVPVRDCKTEEDWVRMPAAVAPGPAILVDGILGTGITGPARDTAAGAIRTVNALARWRPVVSIDIPSGLNADTGQAEGETVRADVTVTLGLPKRGLLTPAALEYTGSLEVVDIGTPAELIERVLSDLELIAAADVYGVMPRRPSHAHKGMFGHVLIIAGASGYAGAASMAARAALRAGVGLATVLTPAAVAPVIAGLVPEAMVHGAAATEAGSLSLTGLESWTRPLDAFDAVLLGPGMTPHEQTRRVVERILATRAPVVLDADALNVCAGHTDMLRRPAGGSLVLTPHPGEMARLLGCTAADVQADRFGAARRAADELDAVVVLKGAGTLVAAPGRTLQVNMTGNPGMATGGMGDALAGLLAGLVAQGIPAFDAARLGVYAHGRAGDRVALRTSQAGMIASDLIEELPLVFRELSGR